MEMQFPTSASFSSTPLLETTPPWSGIYCVRMIRWGFLGANLNGVRTANPRGEVIIVSNKTKNIGVMFFFWLVLAL